LDKEATNTSSSNSPGIWKDKLSTPEKAYIESLPQTIKESIKSNIKSESSNETWMDKTDSFNLDRLFNENPGKD
jgi:hypothetical protein